LISSFKFHHAEVEHFSDRNFGNTGSGNNQISKEARLLPPEAFLELLLLLLLIVDSDLFSSFRI